MNETIVLLHWVYAAVMFSGAGYFIWLSRRPTGIPSYEFLIASIIPIWSGLAYFSIAIGQGLFETSDKTVYFARYIDWVVTTPLLLVALALTAMFYSPRKNKVLIWSLVSADVLMILTGLIGDFSPPALTYVWYFIGVGALVFILYLIWGPLLKIAREGGLALEKHFKRTAAYLTILWVCYPSAWIIGPSGLGLTQELTDVAIFIFLPILSKVGFSLLDLHGLKALHAPAAASKKTVS
ncbi:bacteriorhodopsin, partial [Jeotgalibacillus campisalis]|uniref:Rhodopsin n=1 Tax=Jeotgalibacillus campisalis TaxID=220754 RepID=A0A0C2RLC5_9BACL